MHGALLTNESGPCLIASGMQVDGDLFMADGFRALSAGEDVVVQLSNTRIGGILTRLVRLWVGPMACLWMSNVPLRGKRCSFPLW
jgi:hypothetical protein